LEKLAAAQIDTESDASDFLFVAVTEVDDLGDQQGGNIIDTEKTVIFQGTNRETLPGAGKAGDDDHVERAGHRSIKHQNFSSSSNIVA
jgi:hypothetical protein